MFPDRLSPIAARTTPTCAQAANIPNPPSSGPYPNQGDGVSDRFDHIYYVAPIDPVSATPAGLAGLARGFLMILNRTRTVNTKFASFPNGATQGKAASSGPFNFNDFDSTALNLNGHVAGGDPLSYNLNPRTADGIFDFNCAGSGGACATPISSTVFLNANGSLSFGGANATVTPTVAALLDLRIPSSRRPGPVSIPPAARRALRTRTRFRRSASPAPTILRCGGSTYRRTAWRRAARAIALRCRCLTTGWIRPTSHRRRLPGAPTCASQAVVRR